MDNLSSEAMALALAVTEKELGKLSMTLRSTLGFMVLITLLNLTNRELKVFALSQLGNHKQRFNWFKIYHKRQKKYFVPKIILLNCFIPNHQAMAAVVCVMFAEKALIMLWVTIIVEFANMIFVRNAIKLKKFRNLEVMSNRFMVIFRTQTKSVKVLISAKKDLQLSWRITRFIEPRSSTHLSRKQIPNPVSISKWLSPASAVDGCTSVSPRSFSTTTHLAFTISIIPSASVCQWTRFASSPISNRKEPEETSQTIACSNVRLILKKEVFN